MIVAGLVLLAPARTKCGHPLQVTNHPRSIVNVFRAALRTVGQCALIDMLTIVAQGNFHVHAKIVTAGGGSDIEHVQIALGAELFLQVEV